MRTYLYKKRKYSRGKKISLAIFSILFLVIIWYRLAINQPNDIASVEYQVKSGDSDQTISRELKELGIIDNRLFFQIHAWLSGVSDVFQVGVYEIPAGATISDIVAQLTKTAEYKPREEIAVTFIEGWTIDQMGDYLFAEGVVPSKDEWTSVVSSIKRFKSNYDFLQDAPNNASLEGFLFPDTYRIFNDATPEDIVKKMLDNFGLKLTPDLRAQIEVNNMSIYDTIILASIIEKEVSAPADMAKVASIFYKRLNANIGLQADSTVNYVTKKDLPAVTLEDTQIDSLYNTYKYAGLPPGPISNPSLSAISAAAHPERNEYYYFLTTPEGRVIYSVTFDEHRQNKLKYL
ncbi:MAG: endolytic transglycosylase MltG [Candidatus Buchananbacteria bacterium CG10_big_fil_rev_8_21_14_0_10_42_9]|uniref:Endolytic murein transglycosylase n=1 Tax=Candidatus Buchananbacteria bacterium CG10_big_fil_rev_8_21_14_0_10_42_9 TaxID=1974526 RepID=A0A2H0VZT2_9BACT|nr:MAG: endolytic transglycosylase MltG [Candidatus Buchananbacteria bacterium CG10_big_fil_rev_8_21_14_0_10_42_9]